MSDASKLPSWVEAARATWTWRGARRPPFAIPPGPEQESVWDYPRPPLLVPDPRRIEVRSGEISIASTTGAFRLLETSHPPTFYLPLADVDTSRLIRVAGGSFCEWKGQAVYFDLSLGERRLSRAAWAYPDPIEERFQELAHRVAFYATHLDCLVDGAQARPQAGGFYGGWITPELTGPFKGDPSTGGWLRGNSGRALCLGRKRCVPVGLEGGGPGLGWAGSFVVVSGPGLSCVGVRHGSCRGLSLAGRPCRSTPRWRIREESA
jgi:uncharacterized protein (DUF427 family)